MLCLRRLETAGRRADHSRIMIGPVGSYRRWGVLALLLVAGCQSKPKAPLSFAQRIASAHGVESWRTQAALAGDLHIEFQGRPPLDAQFTYEIATGRTRMQLADDTILVFDGQKAWVSPASAPTKQARFTLRTWLYFVTLPLRLQDAGTNLVAEEVRELGSVKYPSARVTFTPGTVDAPDDWHIVYADPKTHRLAAAAYVLTYGRSVREANEKPHAITYYDTRCVEGVFFGTEWKLWQWTEEAGIHGKPIGSARVYNLEFVRAKPGAFTGPANAREEELQPAKP